MLLRTGLFEVSIVEFQSDESRRLHEIGLSHQLVRQVFHHDAVRYVVTV